MSLAKSLAKRLAEQAPCAFCGYNGEGFYQVRTHGKNCPWYALGGADVRLDVIKTVFKKEGLEYFIDTGSVHESIHEQLHGHEKSDEDLGDDWY